MIGNNNISADFLRSARQFHDRLFYSDAKGELTYGEMADIVTRLAEHFGKNGRPRRIGILGTRSFEAYAGVLAAGLSGAAYVPLNLKWPVQRIVELLQVLDLDALVADGNGANLLTDLVLAAAPDAIILADTARDVVPRPGQSVTRFHEIEGSPLTEPVPVAADDLAYIIFTSGTTGTPKGVMISAGSLQSYLDQSKPWTQLTPEDRLAETCDLTFDLSVHNLFLCADAGASLHVLSALDMLAPARFVRAHEISVWMSVPTLAAIMRKNGSLKPGIFPQMRLSIFCGEPLPLSAAQIWAEATPNGVVENIYGPTEGTVICMRQRLTSPAIVTGDREIVAIGVPYPTMKVAIFDEQQRALADGMPGEIALSGPQLALGYLNASPSQADRFRVLDGERWYLTGDLGMRDRNGVFHHLGRTDNQVKVKGNRVELEEVEAHLRKACGSDMVAVVAWPVVDGSPQALVGFCVSTRDIAAIKASMLETLPRYMVPTAIEILETLPVNINGKVDRSSLLDLLGEAGARQEPRLEKSNETPALNGA